MRAFFFVGSASLTLPLNHASMTHLRALSAKVGQTTGSACKHVIVVARHRRRRVNDTGVDQLAKTWRHHVFDASSKTIADAYARIFFPLLLPTYSTISRDIFSVRAPVSSGVTFRLASLLLFSHINELLL